MTRLMHVGLLVGFLAMGIIIGGYIGAHYAASAFGAIAYAKPEVEMATNAAQTAEWLAELRLGDTDAVIRSMENSLNLQVQTLAAWDEVIWLDDRTRQARDKWLVPVKVYRDSFPATSGDMSRAEALLSSIPGRDPQSTCKSGVCRLDDLRLEKAKTQAKSP